jgi:hypothetical protein
VRPSSAVIAASNAAQTVELALDVLGQAPVGLDVSATPTVPAGWSAKPLSFRLSSQRLPVQWTGPLTITVPANTPLGAYPLQVAVSADGANTVTRNVTIEVRPAGTCLPDISEQCAVDLTHERNHDGTATVAQSREGNFDGGGWSFDGNLLPVAGPVTWSGVTYSAPEPSGSANNFVEARGQGILLPRGNYQTLHLLSVSHHGPVTTTLTVRYSDGSQTDIPVTAGDWAGSAPSGTTVVLDMPHRIKAGSGVDGPPVRLFGQSLALDPAKQVHSMTLPNDARFEVYAVSLSEPK